MKKSILLTATSAVLFATLFVACKKESQASLAAPKSAETSATLQTDWGKQGYISATILDATGLGGCGFVLELDSKQKLEPTISISEEFKKEGLKIWLKYQTPKHPQPSICMIGQQVEVVDIKTR